MKKKVISFFKKNPGRSFKSKELAKKLGFHDEHEYHSLKAMLHSLEEEQFLTRKGKKYQINNIPDDNKIIGALEITQGGFGFVIPDNKKISDIFISVRNLSTAFSGDKVEVSLFAKQKGKNLEGQITGIIKRKREEIVGTVKKTKSFYFVKPDEKKIHRDIYIDSASLGGAKEGDKVVLNNFEWNSSMLNPEGKISEVIGRSGSKDAEIVSIAREFGLPYKFSNATIAEAEKIPLQIPIEELKSRLDYRDKNVVTIDPYDAKDFDDALSIEELENGYFSIGIHIADVSHYVREESSLNKEALQRGNSVYLVGKVIPMLPERLSNNICSLVPYEDRLTYSVIVELTKRGKVENYEIKKTVINSKRRYTYEEVQEIIEKKSGDFQSEILALHSLAQTLRKKRMREGSIEFSTSEVKFELTENNKPIAIKIKEIKESNMLVEEFMLLANKICAAHIGAPKHGPVKPFAYRVHDLPDKEKVFEFSRFVKSLGYSFDPKASSKSNQFQLLMNQVKGTEEESVVNELAIRSMAKAIYSTKNIGHYGLGFKYYTHFTSPIRRYADLIVHRLLFKYITNNKQVNHSLSHLDDICEHISQTERNAIEAERLSVKLKQIEFLKDHVGEEFHAVISGITHFGMFIKLTDILAEGLVRLRDMEGDFYVYDDKKYSLIGKRSNRQFRLGDKISVKLVRADLDKSELDFIIIE